MRVGYPLDGKGGRQAVLYGAGSGRRVGPQDHGVRRTLKRREKRNAKNEERSIKVLTTKNLCVTRQNRKKTSYETALVIPDLA